MSAKKAKIKDDELAEFREKSQVSGSKSFHILSALVLAGLPIYLYHFVFDQTVQEFYYGYAAAFVFNVFCLLTAYTNVMQGIHAKLAYHRKRASADHKKLGMSREQLERVQEFMTIREADTWSLFQNNVLFVLSFLFLAFYALKTYQTQINYVGSVGLSSAFVWQFSTQLK